MFGEYDGFAIAEMPDSVSAGAVSVAVSSSGAIARASTHELLDADGRDALIEKAGRPWRPTHRRRADAHRWDIGLDPVARDGDRCGPDRATVRLPVLRCRRPRYAPGVRQSRLC
jgi:hypothetical protein